MIMNTSNRLTLTALAVATILLAACGESDLKDQHNSELEAARAALNDEQGPSTGPGDSADPDESDTASEGIAEQPSLGAAVAGVNLDEYSLVFQDEFSGSEIDAAKWNTALPWGPDLVVNDELQYYVDTQGNPDFGYDPFVLDGMALTLTAGQAPEGYEDRANDQSWLSGVLSSHEKFAFTHGYIEARVDVPVGQGLWPAFWMLSSEFTERKPQLFIMEHNGAEPETVNLNYNFENDEGQLSTFGQKPFAVEGFDEGFNVIALEWSPEALKYFANGQLLRTIPSGSLPEQDMYLILNLAIGGTFVGAPDSSTPAEPAYKIDYVRVYQKP